MTTAVAVLGEGARGDIASPIAEDSAPIAPPPQKKTHEDAIYTKRLGYS